MKYLCAFGHIEIVMLFMNKQKISEQKHINYGSGSGSGSGSW